METRIFQGAFELQGTCLPAFMNASRDSNITVAEENEI